MSNEPGRLFPRTEFCRMRSQERTLGKVPVSACLAAEPENRVTLDSRLGRAVSFGRVPRR